MRWPSFVLVLALLASVVGCDHTSKHLAERHLGPSEAVDLVPGVLDLRLVKNTDSAFSLLGELMDEPTRLVVILVLQALVTIGMFAWVIARWHAAGTLERAASAVMLGGAIGNFSERLSSGYVVDFIHLRHWPVFNVADIAICVGVVLLLLAARCPRARAPG